MNDDVVRKGDREWIEMTTDVKTLKTEMRELRASNFRQERYLVGGFDANGDYEPGQRDVLKDFKGSVEKKFDAVEQKFDTVEQGNESLRRVLKWCGRALWALALASVGHLLSLWIHPSVQVVTKIKPQ